VVPQKTTKTIDACAPLNLGYLASYVLKFHPEIEIEIIDDYWQNIFNRICALSPDIVGVTATTPQVPSAYLLLKKIRLNNPSILTVMGGIHASVMSNEALEYADVVVVGEGEKAFLKIVEDLYIRNIKNQGIIEGETVENLDELPSPAFNLIDMKRYFQLLSFCGKKSPAIGITSSRGCPFRCKFCYNSFRKTKVRYFSANRIVNEIEYFKNEYGISNVVFTDDDFLTNKERLLNLLSEFEKRKMLGWVKWACQARVQVINENILLLAKAAGCVRISSGFENRNQRILSYLKNNTTTLQQQDKAIQIAKKVGVTMGGSIILGTPSETLQEMKNTIKWFEETPDVAFLGINNITPYPGTPIWQLCQKNGLLPKDIDYEKLVSDNPRNAYVINRTVDVTAYFRFFDDAIRLNWMYGQIRTNLGLKYFLSLSKLKTWWYILVFHPVKFAKMFRFTIIKGETIK